ncbi:hypothetical protein CHL76_11915 [Marinococcus halophilus]|uniref:Xaa-Pro dipeptidase n=1 Tax=Marinococcus halophilus TaxID=1371 RepID=A0A510Y7T8_MARHA|nr:Xaa-Pro peptidase family protein [Marinococcus halophilus]OZT79616.1 hypothetical protein CHL76_11915 [Marinococcus halophilus]GEK59450.1 Xaa-Pro dipeptidase [Marinococcus halophilus]
MDYMEELNFTETDIRQRVLNCQKRLKQEEYTGLILSAEPNINYYSDFRTHAPWSTMARPIFLFIGHTGLPILYVHVFQYPEAKMIAKGCEVRYYENLFSAIESELAGIMQELDMAKGKVGVEKGKEQLIGFNVNVYEALKKNLPQATFFDASKLIWSQRMIKSEKEINCIKRACDATSYAHEQTFAAIQPGMTEWEIARLAQQYMLDGGADYPGFVLITSGAGNYDRLSKTATERALSKGDFIFLDLGAKYNGYWSDFSRTGFLGKKDEQRNFYQDKIHEVTMNTIEHISPGVPVTEVVDICTAEIKKAGISTNFECGRLGHGMGLMSTEPPSIMKEDNAILEEGMIINLEPGIVNELGAFILEEDLVITKNGCEILSGANRNVHFIV